MNEYKPYNPADIDIMLTEPWEISDDPYKLHAAYAISCLYDVLVNSDDEDERITDLMWCCKTPRKIIDRLAQDIADDFNDAATNYKPIKIWGRSYAIRKTNAYDHKRLHKVFQFPLGEDGEYIIVKEGILDLAGETPTALQKYETSREEAQANRTYLRQIIALAEDDKNNGWDSLTDMEIVVYCWALFYNKKQFDNWLQFCNEYKDYIYVPEAEIEDCWTAKTSLRGKPFGMYPFSAAKVQEWNNAHGQKSVAAEIPEEKAEDYWYDVALKNTFKPIDQR